MNIASLKLPGTRWGLATLSFIFLSATANSQQLQIDTAVRVGKLANGFTYYLRNNKEPEHRAELYLAIKAGSILETDHQRGLAHFVEHMSFNGTRHFPKHELIEYLQKSGVRFGADLNAYTGFDETIYQLPISTKDTRFFRNALQIMCDWAQAAALDSIEIEKERGVILEEKRLRMGADQRVFEKTFPLLVNNSRYSYRLPIGTDSVLHHFPMSELRNFYRTWYRPDLQALIIVGDIDVAAVEKAVVAMFANLKNPPDEVPRTKFEVGLTGKNQFRVVTDAEIPQILFTVTIKHDGLVESNITNYRKNLLVAIIGQMMNGRINEFNQRPGLPLLGVNAGIGDLLGNLRSVNIRMTLKENQLSEGIRAGWAEMQRMAKFGFTENEWKRAMVGLNATLDQQVKEKDKRPSVSYVSAYQKHFLKGEIPMSTEAEAALAKQLLAGITLSDINSELRSLLKDHDRDLIIVAPQRMKDVLPAEDTVLRWMEIAAGSVVGQYEDTMTGGQLMDKVPTGGELAASHTIPAIGVTELTLSNGVKVILKPTTFQNDAIQFSAYSRGGSSLYPDADFQSAASAAGIINSSGIGRYNATVLSKMLNGKLVNVSPYISDYYEGIVGASTGKDLAVALQLTYLYFTQPRMDSAAFARMISNAAPEIQNRYQNPDNVFADSVAAVMSNYNIRRTGPSLQKMAEINPEKATKIYRERFANAADFTFVFTGSFTVDSITPLLAKYLGALPASPARENYRDLNIKVPVQPVSRKIYKGSADKATVQMIITGVDKDDATHELNLRAIKEILQYRLTERLRENESGVYTPSVQAYSTFTPRERYTLVIRFGCSPANVDKLIAATREEMTSLKTNGISATDLQKFRAAELQQQPLRLHSNQFWLGYLENAYKQGRPASEVLRYTENLKQLNTRRLKEAARQYLNTDNMAQFILLPEK